MDVLKVQKGVAQSLGLSQGASVGSGLPRNGAPMIDINKPDHEAALVDACAISRSATSIKVIAANPSILDTRPLVAKALANLSSPASAAELIQQLVKRAGTQKHVAPGSRGVVVRPSKAESVDEEEFWFNIRDTSALITRLLALAPNAGAEAVLRALRGES